MQMNTNRKMEVSLPQVPATVANWNEENRSDFAERGVPGFRRRSLRWIDGASQRRWCPPRRQRRWVGSGNGAPPQQLRRRSRRYHGTPSSLKNIIYHPVPATREQTALTRPSADSVLGDSASAWRQLLLQFQLFRSWKRKRHLGSGMTENDKMQKPSVGDRWRLTWPRARLHSKGTQTHTLSRTVLPYFTRFRLNSSLAGSAHCLNLICNLRN